MEKEMHLVIVATGSYEDYMEITMFVTDDKEKALLWVKKYNKIIEDNTERMEKYVFKSNQEKYPFWYELINYEQPKSMVREIKYRP